MLKNKIIFNRAVKLLTVIFLVFVNRDLALAQDATLTNSVVRGHVSDVQVIPPSVEAASLSRYGNQNVSKFTGLPSIEIPIFQLQGADISHSVSLINNSSGLRPGERAGWIGNGWTLNVGCVIARSVQGAPDLPGNYYNAQAADFAPPNSLKLFDYQSYLDQIEGGTIERQPDLYHFNLGGYSGKFEIAHNGTVYQKEASLLKIIPSNVMLDTFSFTVIDPAGIVYYFTEREQTRMMSNDFGDEANRTNYNFTSSWYVSKIVNPYSRETIEFEYHTMSGEEELLRANNSVYSITVPVTDLRNIQCYPSNTSNSKIIVEPFTYIKKKFLKSVALDREGVKLARVDINSVTGLRKDSPTVEERQLNSIQVSKFLNGEIIPLKTMNFYYSYFSNLTNSPVYERFRLRLDSLVESAGSDRMPPYVFAYQESLNLPSTNTKNIDHWGYFNGKNNTNLVPNLKLPGAYGVEMDYGGGADRSPSVDACRFGVLRSLQYPGGGRTVYEFELNRAFFEGKEIAVGGVRLSSITDYSSSNIMAGKRRYQYLQEDGKSSGFIGRMPQYSRTSTRLENGLPIGWPGANPCQMKDRIFMTHTLYSTSIYGLGSFEGSQIGYERVMEEMLSPSDQTVTGRTVSIYSRGWVGEEEDRSAGKLLSQKIYDISNRLVKEQKFVYEKSIAGNLYGYYSDANHSQTSYSYYCKQSEFQYLNYSENYATPSGCVETKRIPTIKKAMTRSFTMQVVKLVKEEDIQYGDSEVASMISQEKSYIYQGTNPLLPSSLVLKRSDGTVLVNNKKYVADFAQGSSPKPAWVRSMSEANRINAEVESHLMTRNGQIEKTIGSNFYEYASGIPKISKIFSLNKLPVGTLFSVSGIDGNGNIIRDPHYSLEKEINYLPNSRINSMLSKDGIVNTYLWDAQFNDPIALGHNTLATDLAYANFETGDSGGWQFDHVALSSLSFTGLRAGSLAAGSKIYKLRIQPSESPLQLELWRKGGSLKVLVNGQNEISPSTVSQIRDWNSMTYILPAGIFSLELSGIGALVDDIRLYQFNGLMESFVYSGKGLSAKLDANNLPLSYEYDQFNRVSAIRDLNQYISEGFHYQINKSAEIDISSGTIFFNAQISGTFTKNDCASNGTLPTQVEYTVPYGRHVSAISQQDADNKAQLDIQENGQAYANTKGKCLFYNDQRSKAYFKNNCPEGKGFGNRVTYIVIAKKHSSEISKADANAKADQDLLDNGQDYANANGVCSCDAPDKKMIAGNCEIGSRIEYSSSYLGNNQWECRYMYRFSDGTFSEVYTEINSVPCPQGT